MTRGAIVDTPALLASSVLVPPDGVVAVVVEDEDAAEEEGEDNDDDEEDEDPSLELPLAVTWSPTKRVCVSFDGRPS